MIPLPTQLSRADLVLVTNATRKLREAEAVFSFVSKHLSGVYSLDQTTLLDELSGVITRTTSPEAPAVDPQPPAAG